MRETQTNQTPISERDGEAVFLREYLADRDAPCPNCEYNLRALTGKVCPECGEPIIIRVALAEPKQAALIAGLIGLSAGAGMNGLLLVYLVLVDLIRGVPVSTREWYAFIAINGGGLVVLGIGIVVWLRFWRMIRSKSASFRWLLVALCWVLTLADVVIFALNIR